MNIIDIEKKLSEVISSDQKSWVKVYTLMQEVEDDKLYEPEYKSYTAWVNSFAERNKVHVSLLWSRKKAGKFYSEYFARQMQNGNSSVVPLQDVTTSPDNIILVEKIAGSNCDLANDLLDKVVKGSLKRRDLSNAWQTVKAERAERGESVQRKNAHDKPINAVNAVNADRKRTEQSTTLTAMDIVLALKNNNWLPKRIPKKYMAEKYRVMTEFAVNTGTTRHSRRMDVLALENISTPDKNDIALHGIEIKVSKNDLLNDKKMEEYTFFCDYFWLAVPEELVENAVSIISDGWGVIAVSMSQQQPQLQSQIQEYLLKVVIPAKRCNGDFRNETINQAILKLL